MATTTATTLAAIAQQGINRRRRRVTDEDPFVDRTGETSTTRTVLSRTRVPETELGMDGPPRPLSGGTGSTTYTPRNRTTPDINDTPGWMGGAMPGTTSPTTTTPTTTDPTTTTTTTGTTTGGTGGTPTTTTPTNDGRSFTPRHDDPPPDPTLDDLGFAQLGAGDPPPESIEIPSSWGTSDQGTYLNGTTKITDSTGYTPPVDPDGDFGHTLNGAEYENWKKERDAFNTSVTEAERMQSGVPPSTEILGEAVNQATGVVTTGQQDVLRSQGAVDQNQQDAISEMEEMKNQQNANVGTLDSANQAVVAGDDSTQAAIADTSDAISRLPQTIQSEFDRQRLTMEESIDYGRIGIDSKESDAIGAVLEGRAGAMDAAVAAIHGDLRAQMSQIDAQVQQGTLSRSQAVAMKAKIRMGGTMQLSAAIGQTTLAFNKLQADVATSFGNMFATFEANATSTEAQFGATAAGAFGQANIAKGELNNALMDMSAQSTQSSNATIANNLATRSQFVASNDTHNMAMLDHTDKEVILAQPAAINGYTAMMDTFMALAKDENVRETLSMMKENMENTEDNQRWLMVMTFLEQFGEKIVDFVL